MLKKKLLLHRGQPVCVLLFTCGKDVIRKNMIREDSLCCIIYISGFITQGEKAIKSLFS